MALAVSAALTSAGATGAEIETIVVTATKRAEDAQDVMVAVQALGGDTLRDLGIETFDEYVEYLPNVVATGDGPGKREITIRGSATEQAGSTIVTPQGSTPGVALYLDEQPVSLGGRNLDVFAADFERIEVLSGPQGTLFGASSQSGNVRLVTRKPTHAAFGAGFNARYTRTQDGAPGAGADGWLNVPLSDAVAVRAVVYSGHQGGWIDNVPGTFTPSAEIVDRNNVGGYGPALAGADSVASVRNDALVQQDWNDASYRGGRLAVAWSMHDDWDVLVAHTAQTLEAEGAFLVEPSLDARHGYRSYGPDYNRDEFGLSALTVEGRMAGLDVIYAGGYLDRQVDNVTDFTHYNNGGGYVTYYLCSGNIYDATDVNNCYDPTKQYAEDTANSRITHELRLATDAARRVRLLGGVYVNDLSTAHIGDFQYASANAAFGEHISSFRNDDSGDGFLLGNISVPTRGINTSGPRSPYTVFFNDFTRTEEETALFGEVAIDLTDAWTLSLSARYYDLTTALLGAANFSFGCRYGFGPNAERTRDGRCNSHAFSNDVTARLEALGQFAAHGDESMILNAKSPNGGRDMFRGGGSNAATLAAIKGGHLDLAGLAPDGSINETDTIVKASVGWSPTDNALFYATYAEGYRPAALNRNAGQLATNQTGVYENYAVPVVARTDALTSVEAGMKSDWLRGSLRLNLTAWRSRIDDMQVARYDPSNVAFLYFVENIGDATSRGLDADFAWAPTDRLSIAGAASLLDTRLTRLNPQLEGVAVPVGSDLPMAPRFAAHLRVQYRFPVPSFAASGFVRGSVRYRGGTVSGIVGSAAFLEDTLRVVDGVGSGQRLRYEGGTFGTIPTASGLPLNARYVNAAATTVGASVGIEKDGWRAELFIANVGNEAARVIQPAGYYTPVATEQRPRSVGLRWSFDVE